MALRSDSQPDIGPTALEFIEREQGTSRRSRHAQESSDTPEQALTPMEFAAQQAREAAREATKSPKGQKQQGEPPKTTEGEGEGTGGKSVTPLAQPITA